MPQTERKHITVKSILYTYPRRPNLGPFCCMTIAVSETQGRQKSEINRMTANRT